MIFLALALFIASFALSLRRQETIGPKAGMVLILLFATMSMAWYASNYFTGEGINQTTFYTLLIGLEGAGFGQYQGLIVSCMATILLAAFLANGYRRKAARMAPMSPSAKKLHFALLGSAFLLNPFTVDVATLGKSLVAQQADNFHDHYMTQSAGSGNGKNLLFIYLESVERSYFDEERFPGLAPHIKKLANTHGIEFTQVQQANGTGYTIAGMVASQCGLPLMVPLSGNNMGGIDQFYPKATCLGDILKQRGYDLTFMQGSSTLFSGIDQFYRTHGFSRVLGKDDLVPQLGNNPPLNGWGLYDDALLNAVKNEFFTLAGKGEKFALFAATLDTHHPNGHLSETCKEDRYGSGDNAILNILQCTDRLVADLVQSILSSRYADNTVIVLASDHLAMRNTASDLLPPRDERRNLFVIIDKGLQPGQKLVQPATTMDIGPTVLHALGIESAIGLGRNLFTTSSLGEDLKDLNTKIASWRDDILAFWDFPQSQGPIKLNVKNRSMILGSRSLPLPALLVLDKNNRIMPSFQDNTAVTSVQLFEHFPSLKPGQRFVWFDSCKIQADSLGTDFEGTDNENLLCAVDGKVGEHFRMFALDQDEMAYDLDHGFDQGSKAFPKPEEIKSNVNMVKMQGGKPYEAALAEGLDFTRRGLPSFVTSVSGLSFYQPQARWSDAALAPDVVIEFKDNLPENFILAIEAAAIGPNIGEHTTIQVSDQTHSLVIQGDQPELYCIAFKGLTPSNKISITPPHPISPAALQYSDDRRLLGIALKSLKILPIEDIPGFSKQDAVPCNPALLQQASSTS